MSWCAITDADLLGSSLDQMVDLAAITWSSDLISELLRRSIEVSPWSDPEHLFARRALVRIIDLYILDDPGSAVPELLDYFQEQIQHLANQTDDPRSELTISSIIDQIVVQRSQTVMNYLIEIIPDYLGHLSPRQEPVALTNAPRWCQEPLLQMIIYVYQATQFQPIVSSDPQGVNWRADQMLSRLFDRIIDHSQNCIYLLGLPDHHSRLDLIEQLLHDYQSELLLIDPCGLFRIACSYNIEITSCLAIDPSAPSEIRYHLVPTIKTIRSHEWSWSMLDLLALLSDVADQPLAIQQHDHELLVHLLSDRSTAGIRDDLDALASYTREHDLPVHYHLLSDRQVMLVCRSGATLADRQNETLILKTCASVCLTRIAYRGDSIVVASNDKLPTKAEIIDAYLTLHVIDVRDLS